MQIKVRLDSRPIQRWARLFSKQTLLRAARVMGPTLAYLPPYLPVLAGRHRSTYGSAAEIDAARPNLDHDERVWQRADGSKARGKRSRR
jgi:hypothetical protein